MNAILPLDRRPVVDLATFRTAFRRLAGGVTVVTVGAGTARTGLTATSVASFSADPASLTLNVAHASSTWEVLAREGRFGVAVLARDQRPVAERFAGFGGVTGAARFEGAEWTTAVTGAPLLVGALAAFDCEVEATLERFGHAVVVGRIRAVLTSADPVAEPLLWADGGFRALA